MITADSHSQVDLILGKRKLPPKPEPTVPQLKLYGTALGVEMGKLILEELDHKLDSMPLFCDSKVVFGYESRRFFVKLHSQVQPVRHRTAPQQWHYVPTDQNAVDQATGYVPTSRLWIPCGLQDQGSSSNTLSLRVIWTQKPMQM